MENLNPLALRDLADWVYTLIQKRVATLSPERVVETVMVGNPMQETFSLKLPDRSNAFVKVFPHKNHLGEGVYRLEVFHTRPGDMRGTRIAFIEVPRHEKGLEETQRFMGGVLPQIGL